MAQHKLLFSDERGIADGTELVYSMKGETLLHGIKQGAGILCKCCNEVVGCNPVLSDQPITPFFSLPVLGCFNGVTSWGTESRVRSVILGMLASQSISAHG